MPLPVRAQGLLLVLCVPFLLTEQRRGDWLVATRWGKAQTGTQTYSLPVDTPTFSLLEIQWLGLGGGE